MKKASYIKPEINVIKAGAERQLLAGSPGSDPIIIDPDSRGGGDSGNADGEANSKPHVYDIKWFYEDYDEDERRWRK